MSKDISPMTLQDTYPEQKYRPELEEIPTCMKHLKVHRGYPVPWFVALVDGVPEFRAADYRKFALAVQHRLCWVCGGKLPKSMTFVAGPMCGINRTSAEPPCHLLCAQWSARNCPFLSRPNMVRRENDMPEGEVAGLAILRNPGVTLLWTTPEYRLFDDGNGGKLFRMGIPTATEWWAEGRPATRQQVLDSIAGGLPRLEEMAATEHGAMDELRAAQKRFEQYIPAR